ncbi:hypothetical protein DDZ15_06220 [Rhodohalobacter mucosus]|uniref:Uncharacterized protein n=1 Tax=Rhodohalobacter mucosus TaxID=2079485 RepID=A0A316TSM1_9BACT|nr:hypothetical protein DDZ15_06220 [Rhodohalobacter mucosus]
MSQEYFSAIANSGLLGFYENDKIPAISVHHFGLYGTQWRPELGIRSAKSDMQNAQSGYVHELYPGTVTESRIMPQGSSAKQLENDVKWIAQFYIIPNRFYFADPYSLALNGPTSINLESRFEVSGTALQCFLCPDPWGKLAMVMVFGTDAPSSTMWETAFDVVIPVLDEISFKYDQPLPIAHSIIVGVPSGVVYTYQFALPNEVTISIGSEIDLKESFVETRDAKALYREAISSNNPFHKFLTFWKVYENVVALRTEWRQKHRKADNKKTKEIIPSGFSFKGYEGLSFDKVRQKMEKSKRHAIAHGGLKDSAPLTSSAFDKIQDVGTSVPVIQYMAKIILENFEATLRGIKH